MSKKKQKTPGAPQNRARKVLNRHLAQAWVSYGQIVRKMGRRVRIREGVSREKGLKNTGAVEGS